MNLTNNIEDKLDYSNLNNFMLSVEKNKIDLFEISKVEKNKILLNGIINAKENNNNEILNYLIKEKKYHSKSLDFLNNKLKLGLTIKK